MDGPPARETPRERAVVLAYETVRACARLLPERTGRALFRGLGSVAYRVLPGVRGTVTANQAQVLGRHPGDPLVEASTREAFRSYGRYWFDTFHVARMTDDQILARVRCDTEDRLDRAEEAGDGAILALPHMGNWDAAGRWMAARGTPVVSVAEELRPRGLFELFLRHRQELGMDIIGLTPGGGVGRQLTDALSAGRFVALVADRDLTGRGIEVEMFGRARMIPTGPALLSVTTGAPLMVCPVFTMPTGWAIRIGEPIPIPSSGDRRDHVEDVARAMATGFERAISEAPSDWHLFQPGWP
jgi:KDO2-lipid IV(A) lauroyltransferase